MVELNSLSDVFGLVDCEATCLATSIDTSTSARCFNFFYGSFSNTGICEATCRATSIDTNTSARCFNFFYGSFSNTGICEACKYSW
jgi:hypothetical protein